MKTKKYELKIKWEDNKMLIDKDMIASIEPTKNGNYKLTIYEDKVVLFEKEYKTMHGANIAQKHYLKKFNLI